MTKVFSNRRQSFKAVNDVNFRLYPGQCLGIVGESGSGKSTAARMIAQLETTTEGQILYRNQDITNTPVRKRKPIYRNMQMIFQNPLDSFDPRRKLSSSVVEVLCNYGFTKIEAQAQMKKLMGRVGLNDEIADRYPHQVSGGQCQRAAIARAIALKPEILICDEATSALDVSVQQQIIELLKELQSEYHLSILFICHDLALVQEMCQRVIVMYEGKIVEEGAVDEVIENPKEVYTRRLLDSVLSI